MTQKYFNEDTHVACVDFEFNIPRSGRLAEKHIVEVGVIICDLRGCEIDRLSMMVRPLGRLSEKTLSFLGKTRSEFESAPSLSDAVNAMEALFRKHNVQMWCSWGDMDLKVARSQFGLIGFHNSLVLSTEYVDLQNEWAYSYNHIGKRMSLIDVVEDFIGVWEGNQHLAVDDAKNLSRVLSILEAN
ncbi:TPA: exonuclease domain-containing protein [Vibrio vulnificus]|uniref:Exonuclease domain-containing protein n=1 Tax=Vibrio vulnificus TaxID=672 RepID=A0A8H9K7G7_VIBVL|nr:exonuclease domain-containing protein [Vibrio vulnificus]HAS8538509.1 exonuclease domain-containing protein [Vibrio vulnificus]